MAKAEFMDNSIPTKTLAVLIDADNISAASAGTIFKKACKLGNPITKQIAIL